MGTQWELHGQGEMINAWNSLYIACLAYPACSDKTGFYKNLADELARTIIGDAPGQDGEFSGNGNPPDQLEPTVDTAGILTDPCTPGWPDNCTYTNPDRPWLIAKGIFELGTYCETNAVNDTVLDQFISQQATAVAGLSQFGPLWDAGTGTNAPVISATRHPSSKRWTPTRRDKAKPTRTSCASPAARYSLPVSRQRRGQRPPGLAWGVPSAVEIA